MTRRVFFSFHYKDDIFVVMQIRNAWKLQPYRDAQPLLDKAEFERIKRTGQSATKNWIDKQMNGCGVLVVLFGQNTHARPWVRYEIALAHHRKMGILGISLEGMKGRNSYEIKGVSPSPFGFRYPNPPTDIPAYPTYNWVGNDGRNNIGNWVETAAMAARR